MNVIGKKVYLKFGKFHGHSGTVENLEMVDGYLRYLVKLDIGEYVYKKVKNVVVMGEVQNDKN